MRLHLLLVALAFCLLGAAPAAAVEVLPDGVTIEESRDATPEELDGLEDPCDEEASFRVAEEESSDEEASSDDEDTGEGEEVADAEECFEDEEAEESSPKGSAATSASVKKLLGGSTIDGGIVRLSGAGKVTQTLVLGTKGKALAKAVTVRSKKGTVHHFLKLTSAGRKALAKTKGTVKATLRTTVKLKKGKSPKEKTQTITLRRSA